MNYHNGGDNNNLSCFFHPNKLIVGVCSLCLKERLLIVASKQEHHQYNSFSLEKKKISTVARKLPKLPKLSSFPDLNRPKQDNSSSSFSSSSSARSLSILSLQDSFISIKLDGGKCTRKGMVKHGKELTMLRWRKLIRYVSKLAQWSWPSKKGRKCHVGVGGEG